MKTVFPIILVLVLLSSCAVKKQSLLLVKSIETKVLNADTLAIRALDYKDGSYWFAGMGGHYGSVATSEGRVVKSRLPEIAQNLEFRSIAVTDSYTYIMSAGSPALCYRLDKKTGNVAEIYRDMDERAFYDAMKFWNDREGIIMGDPMDDCFSILKTTDGGNTFTKINCDAFPDFVEGEAAFAASNSNIAIVGDEVWLATGGKRARVFHSTDRGTTWSVVDTPIIAGGAMTGIFAMDFYEAKQGIIIGGNWEDKNDTSANKAVTMDGGKTWNLIGIGTTPKYCSDIMYIPGTSGNELLAVGSEGVWWSGDKGMSWKLLTEKGYYTVSMEDASHGVLAGRNSITRFVLNR